jgi:hypothetical protein
MAAINIGAQQLQWRRNGEIISWRGSVKPGGRGSWRRPAWHGSYQRGVAAKTWLMAKKMVAKMAWRQHLVLWRKSENGVAWHQPAGINIVKMALGVMKELSKAMAAQS